MDLMKRVSAWLSPAVNSFLIMWWFSLEWLKDKFKPR
jgi:hypothetical protein